MTNELRDSWFGRTVTEYIDARVGELQSDAVVFVDIIHTGRHGFGFHGAEPTGFVRRCLTGLMDHGARPVIGGGDSGYYWALQSQYGSAAHEIVDNVIAEWLANGDPDHGGLWFALPEQYEARWKK